MTSNGTASDIRGWVDQPDGRGTLNIISSCLLTIFVCCWTSVHPDIAEPRSTYGQRMLDKTACLLVAVVAPEIIVWLSFNEYGEARSTSSVLSQRNRFGSAWTMTHSFFLHMGGFYAPTGGSCVGSPGWLDERGICKLVELGKLDSQWLPRKVEIDDKAKADNFVKLITLCQSSWLLVQCIARAVRGLHVTTLELATLPYIPCTILVLFFWWHKPMDVQQPIVLRFIEDGGAPSSGELQMSPSQRRIDCFRYDTFPLVRRAVVIVDSALWPVNIYGGITAVFCFFFGGLHCIAWNSHFPTEIERSLWRICSIVIACSIPASWLLARCIAFLSWACWTEGWQWLVKERWSSLARRYRPGVLFSVTHGTGLCLYVVARMYLMIEMFTGLRSLPAEAFDTLDWLQMWPHAG